MAEQLDVEKQEHAGAEHRSPAPHGPGMSYASVCPLDICAGLISSSDGTDRRSWDQSTRRNTDEHGAAPERGRQAADVPGAEKVTEDGRIIHGWNGPNDPDQPFNWPNWYKWVLTVTVCFVSILTGLPAGSYGSGSSDIATQFNIMNKPFDNTIWATVSWNMGAAIWPLIFVPLTESKGRMPGYVLTACEP